MSHRMGGLRQQGGFSLVELMVGLVVSGLVIAAAGAATADQLAAARDATLRLRADQDLRALGAVLNRWARQAVAASPGGEVFEIGASGESLRFAVITEPYGDGARQTVSIRLAEGVVQWRWGESPSSRWQALTDGQSLRVESLRFESRPLAGLEAVAHPCLAWPALHWSVQARAATPRDPRAWPPRTETHRVQVRVAVPQAECES